MILVFGENGQLASAFRESQELLANQRWQFISSQQAPFETPEKVLQLLSQHKPQIIINAAAYTMVDKAESEVQKCNLINAEAPTAIAQWALKNNALLVHYSTDYVFDGSGQQAWKESDRTAPVNAYGQSKLLGEQGILSSGCQSFIFRTSWVYHHVGNNFVRTMLRLGAEREELKIVNDQIGAPTYAADIAEATCRLLSANQKQKFESGIYNMTNQGQTSWYEFANAIFMHAKNLGFPLKVKQVLPIASKDFVTAARRPQNSRLDGNKLLNVAGEKLPLWSESLAVCMKRMKDLINV